MAHVFVSDFPVSEATHISQAILSRQFSVAMIRDAWVVAEYVVNVAIPAGVVAKSGPEVFPDEAMQELHEACLAHTGLATALPPLPWLAILRAILTAILALI